MYPGDKHRVLDIHKENPAGLQRLMDAGKYIVEIRAIVTAEKTLSS